MNKDARSKTHPLGCATKEDCKGCAWLELKDPMNKTGYCYMFKEFEVGCMVYKTPNVMPYHHRDEDEIE